MFPRKKWLWMVSRYGFIFMRKPPLENSKYYGMFPPTVYSANYKYAPTIDDDWLKYVLADKLEKKLQYKSDLKKANFILKFVQHNITYKYDSEQYGVNELHALPINTVRSGYGDCEDIAFLFSFLAYHCGLDVITFGVPAHCACAVCVDGAKGASYEYSGKRYYWCEGTERGPVGKMFSKYSRQPLMEYPSTPQTPSEEWTASLYWRD